MRILTVRQPWAWAIIHGGKNVENRSRNIAGQYRGPVAIHAGLQWDSNEDGSVQMTPLKVADAVESKGHIIGVVDLVDVHAARATASGVLIDWAEHTRPGELCSPWSEWDVYHMVLANPRLLAEPIPYKGALGLREVPADLLARIEAAL